MQVGGLAWYLGSYPSIFQSVTRGRLKPGNVNVKLIHVYGLNIPLPVVVHSSLLVPILLCCHFFVTIFFLPSTRFHTRLSLCVALLCVISMVLLARPATRTCLRSAARYPSAIRHFTAQAALRQEIRDAYILGASRTPTAKVRHHTGPPRLRDPFSRG